MSTNKIRYYYLDILKFIAIFLVCSYHFTFIYKVLYLDGFTPYVLFNRFITGLSSICIPLFLMVNGALLLNSRINIQKHIIKSRIIFFQYLIWRCITIITISVSSGVDLLSLDFSKLFNIFLLFDTVDGVDIAHLWFIPCLLCIYIIAPVIKKEYDSFFENSRQSYLFTFMGILFLLCFVIGDISTLIKSIPAISDINISQLANTLNPFVGLVGPMVFYFLLGGIFHKQIHRLRTIKTGYLIIAFISGALLLLIKWVLETSAAETPWDIVYGAYNCIPTLIMSASLFIFISKVNNSTIDNSPIISSAIQIIGNNTMNVYYLHWIFGYTVLAEIIAAYPNFKSIPFDYIKSLLIVIGFSLLSELLKKIPVIKKLMH